MPCGDVVSMDLMIKRIRQCIRNFIYSKEDIKTLRAIEKKSELMAKYGGRMVVVGRGTLTDSFDTEEGRIAYYDAICEPYREAVREIVEQESKRNR